MGLFFTGKGDAGVSDLGKNKKVDKTCLEIVALGDLDELNSLLGVVKNLGLSEERKKVLEEMQENLFIVQAHVAYLMMEELKYAPPAFPEEKVKKTEDLINKLEEEVQPEKGFIVAGSNPLSGWLDYARAVSRRAERSVVQVNKSPTRKDAVNPVVMAYMNRISSLLFALARIEAKSVGLREEHPQYK